VQSAPEAKRAEVTVASLDDWEKQWNQDPQKFIKPAVVQVDFRVPAGMEVETPPAVAWQAGG